MRGRGDLVVDAEQNVWQVTEFGKNREQVYRTESNEGSGEDYLLDDLHEAVVHGTEPPTSGRQNLKTLKLLLKIMAAGNRT